MTTELWSTSTNIHDSKPIWKQTRNGCRDGTSRKRIKLPGTALSTSSHLDCLTATFYLCRIWRLSPIRFCRMESIRITTATGSLPMSGIWRFSAACLWPIRHVVSSMRLVSRCVEERCAFRHSTCAWCICRNISK